MNSKFSFICALLALLNAIFALPLTSMLKVNSTASTTAQAYEVSSLPGLEKMDPKFVPEMHAGYIEIDPSTKEDYFFWKFSKIHEDSKADNRLIFWFNGGPGCSSMDGALEETGPLTVNDQGEVEYRAGSWLENGNLVFVDQPAGTGFSTGDKYADELTGIASDMLVFIRKYLGLFPEDAKKEIYLSGESYAGQYVPYFGAKILMDAPEINLQGLVIVNGYIYPDVQDSALLDFALSKNVITETNYKDAKENIQQCENAIIQAIESYGNYFLEMGKKGEYTSRIGNYSVHENTISSDECANLLDIVIDMNYNPNATVSEQCVNIYDYKMRDSYPSCGDNFPSGESKITDFLRNKEVDSSLNIHQNIEWSQCSSNGVYDSLKNTKSFPAYFKLPYILSKIKVMIIAGEDDIVCNKLGLEKMVSKLIWGGNRVPGFIEGMPYTDFVVDEKVYGGLKIEKNLYFAGVEDASHMVPYSQPIAARALLDIFLGNYTLKGNQFIAPSHGDF